MHTSIANEKSNTEDAMSYENALAKEWHVAADAAIVAVREKEGV